LKAYVHVSEGSTWELEGDDWDVTVTGDIATVTRHRPGRPADTREPAVVFQVQANAYVLFGDEHPHER